MGNIDARIHKVIQERLENIEALFLSSASDDERLKWLLSGMDDLSKLCRSIKSEVRDIQAKLNEKEKEKEKKPNEGDQNDGDDDSTDRFPDNYPNLDYDNWPQLPDATGVPGTPTPLPGAPVPLPIPPLLLPMRDGGGGDPTPQMVGMLLSRHDPNDVNSAIMSKLSAMEGSINIDFDHIGELLTQMDSAVDAMSQQLIQCCTGLTSGMEQLSNGVTATQQGIDEANSGIEQIKDTVGATVAQSYQQLVNELRRGHS